MKSSQQQKTNMLVTVILAVEAAAAMLFIAWAHTNNETCALAALALAALPVILAICSTSAQRAIERILEMILK